MHIDELLESSEQLPHIEQLVNRSVSDLFRPANTSVGDEDIEEIDVDESHDASLPSSSQKPPVESIEVKSDRVLNMPFLINIDFFIPKILEIC